MNAIGIFKALEVELKAVSDGIPTIFDNSEIGTGEGFYQEAWVLLAKPENPSQDTDHYRQRGYLQVALKFPQNIGAGEARERGLFLRDHFHNGLSLIAEGVTTIVEGTPEVGSGSNVGGRYVINVFVHFRADIFGA